MKAVALDSLWTFGWRACWNIVAHGVGAKKENTSQMTEYEECIETATAAGKWGCRPVVTKMPNEIMFTYQPRLAFAASFTFIVVKTDRKRQVGIP